MQVFDVKFLDFAKNGNRYFMLFGSEHASIDELTDDLRENTIVSGLRFIWRREGNETIIEDEMPVSISKNAIYSISLPSGSIVRYEG